MLMTLRQKHQHYKLEHRHYTLLERLTQWDHCRPWACHEGEGDMELQLHSFLTSAQDKVLSFALRPLYPPGKSPAIRKVAGPVPDGVVGIFHWHNPSGRAMALGSIQPLTEMSTRNISWEVKAASA